MFITIIIINYNIIIIAIHSVAMSPQAIPLQAMEGRGAAASAAAAGGFYAATSARPRPEEMGLGSSSRWLLRGYFGSASPGGDGGPQRPCFDSPQVDKFAHGGPGSAGPAGEGVQQPSQADFPDQGSGLASEAVDPRVHAPVVAERSRFKEAHVRGRTGGARKRGRTGQQQLPALQESPRVGNKGLATLPAALRCLPLSQRASPFLPLEVGSSRDKARLRRLEEILPRGSRRPSDKGLEGVVWRCLARRCLAEADQHEAEGREAQAGLWRRRLQEAGAERKRIQKVRDVRFAAMRQREEEETLVNWKQGERLRALFAQGLACRGASIPGKGSAAPAETCSGLGGTGAGGARRGGC